MGRRAKIVCTLGPAVASQRCVEELIDAGMDVARLNLAHGTKEDHAVAYERVRAAAEKAGRTVAVLADLPGPKLRLGTFAGGHAELVPGSEFVIVSQDCLGSAQRASTTYRTLPAEVRPGDRILLNDGAIRLEVLTTTGAEVVTRVVEGGTISNHKGMNLPGVVLQTPALTDTDDADLRFALELGVDLVALSFVRHATDAAAVRAVMDDVGRHVPVLAKLEKPEAVAKLEAIVAAFDGIMVARGDLGVELPLEDVPLVQKRAIALARASARPVIVATQMLESMITRTRPTRAEVSDVANAVLDGADAVMLSAETSVGAHPAEAVRTIARIVVAAERSTLQPGLPAPAESPPWEVAIAEAAITIAERVNAAAIVAFTSSGATARRLASHRSKVPLIAMTPDPGVHRALALVWGVQARQVDPVGDTDEMVGRVDQVLVAEGRTHPGDAVVLVAGTPPGVPGRINTIRVHRVASR
ncbi:MAG: pyruvate kinase [Actinomycetota bacterium]